MKEYSFRITQNQLRNLGGQMAAKATNKVLLCTCGSGYAQLSEGLIRESWLAQDEYTFVNQEGINQHCFGVGKKYCVFANDLKQLEQIAYSSETCLWGILENDLLKMYHYQEQLLPIDVVIVVGHTLQYSFSNKTPLAEKSQLHERTVQAFGRGTTEYLSNLTVGVVGVSGTGSIVAEQLYRLGVKRLLLVDDDYVEIRNLGRILNSTSADAQERINKAEMLKRAYDRIGLNTEVIAIPTVIAIPETVRQLSQCDFIFGCLDSADGRMHLNRLCTFYTLPYIDLGVKLKSEYGDITEISGAVRYMIPGAASMLSIGAYTTEQVESEALRRDDPVAYHERLNEKYIQGAQEGSPAVISVNMLISSLAVLELLNRIHQYRDTPNESVEVLTVNLLEPAFPEPAPPGKEDFRLSKYLGKGDCIPLLDMPGIGV